MFEREVASKYLNYTNKAGVINDTLCHFVFYVKGLYQASLHVKRAEINTEINTEIPYTYGVTAGQVRSGVTRKATKVNISRMTRVSCEVLLKKKKQSKYKPRSSSKIIPIAFSTLLPVLHSLHPLPGG